VNIRRGLVVLAAGVALAFGVSACSADQVKEQAAGIAADQLAPQMQQTLGDAGFTNVVVTSGMENSDDTGNQERAVLLARVGIPQLNESCSLGYKALVTSPDTIYFDKIYTTEDPDGARVSDDSARSATSPADALAYLASNHSACLVRWQIAKGCIYGAGAYQLSHQH
jgi:hypothetical protein